MSKITTRLRQLEEGNVKVEQKNNKLGKWAKNSSKEAIKANVVDGTIQVNH